MVYCVILAFKRKLDKKKYILPFQVRYLHSELEFFIASVVIPHNPLVYIILVIIEQMVKYEKQVNRSNEF